MDPNREYYVTAQYALLIYVALFLHKWKSSQTEFLSNLNEYHQKQRFVWKIPIQPWPTVGWTLQAGVVHISSGNKDKYMKFFPLLCYNLAFNKHRTSSICNRYYYYLLYDSVCHFHYIFHFIHLIYLTYSRQPQLLSKHL